jgi:AcrR family transcriptional regulator
VTRRQIILDATLSIIRSVRDWTLEEVTAAVESRNSIIYHYFGSKEKLLRAAYEHYSTQQAGDISIDLAIWVAMRFDPELARMVLEYRARERDSLKGKFRGTTEAWLAQALHVGLGIMRVSGIEVNEEGLEGLLFDLMTEAEAEKSAKDQEAN